MYKGPAEAAETFITALAEQDWKKVEKTSSGRALYTINTRKEQVGSLYAAKIVDLQINVMATSKRWASAQVIVETALSDGDVDVSWYDLMLRNENGWKVYRVASVLPVLNGTPNLKGVSKVDVQKIQEVFSDYLTCLAQNRYMEAGRYLVGLSRQQFEAGKDALAASPVIKTFEGIAVEPVWHKDNMVISKVSYKADSRPVSVMVWMYNTSVGWKIANVETI
ncbi:MAG: hypothetical protein FH756_00390 [Firmicutes bacterium]|nr:hypothetical protein [Bacillota bacterium]